MGNKYITRESEIIDNVRKIFPSDKGYSFIFEPQYFRLKQNLYIPDLLLYKNEKPFALIEIKLHIKQDTLSILQARMKIAAAVFGTRFTLVTDGREAFVIDISKQGKFNDEAKQLKLEEVLQYIESANKINKPFGPFKDIEEFKTEIKNALAEINQPSFKDLKDMLEENPEDAISFSDSNSFDFSNSFKKKILNSLESPKDGSELCRYTSLSSLFRQINSNQHSMASLEGMNDSSEIDYVDSLLLGDGVEAQAFDQGEGNIFFILSLCGKEQVDNLTLWRLYGDDSKGVCIVYEPLSADLPIGFMMKNIVYDDKLLSILKSIIGCIQGKEEYKYVYRNDTWKHFFKPKDYEIEKEVRLLLNKKETRSAFSEIWIHNTTYNIVHPILLFNNLRASNNFPMQMKKIILGPNMPEAELNQKQIKQWVKSKGLQIEVELSKIGNYRTS